MCHMLCVTCYVSHVICHMSSVTCHVSHVTCHMSRVTCHVSHVQLLLLFLIFFEKIVELVGGGSGIYPV